MRKEKRKVEMKLEQISCWRDRFEIGCLPDKYTYEFTSLKPIDTGTLEFFTEVDVPETLSEFRQLNNLSKEELVEWLNKNYK